MPRTIVKVHNPRLRWFAGFNVVVSIILLSCAVSYGFGRFFFWISETVSANATIELSGITGLALTAAYGLVWTLLVGMGVAVLVIACIGIHDGAKALGEYLFDP